MCWRVRDAAVFVLWTEVCVREPLQMALTSSSSSDSVWGWPACPLQRMDIPGGRGLAGAGGQERLAPYRGASGLVRGGCWEHRWDFSALAPFPTGHQCIWLHHVRGQEREGGGGAVNE